MADNLYIHPIEEQFEVYFAPGDNLDNPNLINELDIRITVDLDYFVSEDSNVSYDNRILVVDDKSKPLIFKNFKLYNKRVLTM